MGATPTGAKNMTQSSIIFIGLSATRAKNQLSVNIIGMFTKLQDEMTGQFYCCWDWWIVAEKCPASAP